MRGRDYLDAVHHLRTAPSETNRRAAGWPLFWALFTEAREALARWSFAAPANANVEEYVIERFSKVPVRDVIQVGLALELLRDYRTSAEDCNSPSADFADDQKGTYLLHLASGIIRLLDQVETDSARKASAIAAIRNVFP